MRKFLPILLLPFLAGCFKHEPKLPQFYSEQAIDVVLDSVICYSGEEDFDEFILTCSQPFDSIHWYLNYSNPTYLGNEDILMLPNHPFGYEVVRCLGFNGTDTTEYQLQVHYCARYMYIPTAFTPDQDGINETWFPRYYSTSWNPDPYFIYWEVRSLDGVKLFETSDVTHAWDGEYNGYPMPPGIYVYYIELTIAGEDPIEYTGWLEILG